MPDYHISHLKYDIIENSKIELRGIVLPVQVGGLLGGGGGAKGMLAPPLKLLGGGGGSPPPSSYAYGSGYETMFSLRFLFMFVHSFHAF